MVLQSAIVSLVFQKNTQEKQDNNNAKKNN